MLDVQGDALALTINWIGTSPGNTRRAASVRPVPRAHHAAAIGAAPRVSGTAAAKIARSDCRDGRFLVLGAMHKPQTKMNLNVEDTRAALLTSYY